MSHFDDVTDMLLSVKLGKRANGRGVKAQDRFPKLLNVLAQQLKRKEI